MGEKKVTIMVLKVDLQCHKCYKKVKKVLCKFPQIRDQIYDEKQNQVKITVVCCNPEKIRDKICCKGGCAIKCIEIIPPQTLKSKETEKSNKQPEEKKEPEKCKLPEEQKDPEKSAENPKNPVKPPTLPIQLVPVVPACQPPVRACCMDCYRGHPGGPCHSPPIQPVPVVPACQPPVRACPPPVRTCCMDCYRGHPGGPCHSPPKQPVPVVPACQPPVRACCMDCYRGHPGGPCYSGYGGGPAPYIQYDGYYGKPVYDSYGGGSRGYCFSEENPSACKIM